MGALVFVLGILVWQGVARLVNWRKRRHDEPAGSDSRDSMPRSIADEAQEWLRQH